MNAMPGKLRVGVSIFIRKGEQSLWENGVYQNCLFLVMLLLRSPRVASTVLVAGGGDGAPADAAGFLADSPVPIIDMATAAQELDVMIEMSASSGATGPWPSASAAARSCRCAWATTT